MSSRTPEDAEQERLRRRHRADRRFRYYGAAAIGLALGALAALLAAIAWNGSGAFSRNDLKVELALEPEALGLPSDPDAWGEAELRNANYTSVVRAHLRSLEPDASGRRTLRALYALVSTEAGFEIAEQLLEDPTLIGSSATLRLPLSDDAGLYLEGGISREVDESRRRVSNQQMDWLDGWVERGLVETSFNGEFFTAGDSREPEMAGLGGALLGSLWTLLVTLALSFPLGVAAAIHLEEFASKGRMTDFLEVNINNLAAVPSIVFGLLGLSLFLNVAGLPRSAPVVGGMVLALMTMPTVIIASRAALRSVPPSIREAAMALGASPVQVVLHHTLPLALPGILTGTIIGMARALGETAPLLMIGMVAFIVDLPEGPLSPSTALPVQIYLWAESPERAFVGKTAGAILVLVGVLLAMNLTAVVLRNRSERTW